MSATKNDLDRALLDVRKAYRLLHDYQRSVLDAAKYIGAQLGFTYCGGYSRFSKSAPISGQGNLDNWSWDWLNLVFYEFRFTRETKGSRGLNCSILLFSDTGFFVSDNPEPDKTEISTFAAVEVSSSKVAFLFYNDPKNRHEAFWEDRDAVRRFLGTGKLPATLERDPIRGACFDFSRMCDAKSADDLIDELVRLDVDGRFQLKRMTKAV